MYYYYYYKQELTAQINKTPDKNKDKTPSE